MEMTPAWKARKRKGPFPLFPRWLEKLAKCRELSPFPQLRRRLEISFSFPIRLTSTWTKSVTYMPGTFCYRHAQPHMIENKLGFSPCGTSFLPGTEFFRSLFSRAVSIEQKSGLNRLRKNSVLYQGPTLEAAENSCFVSGPDFRGCGELLFCIRARL